MKDLYFKSNIDITYDSSKLLEDDRTQQLISQIKMLLFTNQGDVLGATEMGMNLERLIFETNYNKFQILNNLKFQMGQYLDYDENLFSIEFDLQFLKGTIRDVALLTLQINGQRSLDILIK